MSLREKTAELHRLLEAFVSESSKFHDLKFGTLVVTQDGASSTRAFHATNHAIMLWQFYGVLDDKNSANQLATNLENSELKWGLRGAIITSFAILEGDACPLFVRMAQRAGSLFDETEARTIQSRITDELFRQVSNDQSKGQPVAATNNNPLAIWLNFLLYHLSLTNPGREREQQIEPDPFSLSVLALERLIEDQTISKIDRSIRRLDSIGFKVALSFSGENRTFVSAVATKLRSVYGPDQIFYDHDYQSQLARPNLDALLENIYRTQCQLIVVFLSKEYAAKQWCGLEWRVVRDIVKSREDDRVMYVRFDDEPMKGLLSIDGYIDARSHQPRQVADFIVDRVSTLSSGAEDA